MFKHCFYRLLAALIFFTRLPFWRLADVPPKYYEHIVPLWPLAGWLTGGCMAAVFYLTAQILPIPVCLLLAILTRILMTGALHEDGLADVCDGFGGGTTRTRILEIMKDSRIGTYGVLGLILYFLFLWTVLFCIATEPSAPHPAMQSAYLSFHTQIRHTAFLICCADTACKYICSHIVNVLSYARKAEEAKAKLVYTRTKASEEIIGGLFGLLPAVLLLPPAEWLCLLPAVCCAALLFNLFRKKINGYTGDCCGAGFLLTEVCFLLSILILHAVLP